MRKYFRFSVITWIVGNYLRERSSGHTGGGKFTFDENLRDFELDFLMNVAILYSSISEKTMNNIDWRFPWKEFSSLWMQQVKKSQCSSTWRRMARYGKISTIPLLLVSGLMSLVRAWKQSGNDWLEEVGLNPASKYTITFARSARKELEALDTSIFSTVFRRIEALADYPRPDGCRKSKAVAILSFKSRWFPRQYRV